MSQLQRVTQNGDARRSAGKKDKDQNRKPRRMKKGPWFFGIALLMLTSFGCPGPDPDPTPDPLPVVTPTGQSTLAVTPIAQQTEVWCWAASAEMVFRYYQLPNLNGFGQYQCGIVAAYFGGPCLQNCALCVAPIGPMSNMQSLIVGYGQFARNLGVPSPTLSSLLILRYLSVSEVKTEIDANRPIVAGISPHGFKFPNISEHIVVIVGYDATVADPALIVNDPFPFDAPAFALQPNPYRQAGAIQIAPGRYRISWQQFVNAMNWGNSIYHIVRN
jgi:hypothetical protein